MSVEHIKTNERGMTRLLVTFPITQRGGLPNCLGGWARASRT